MLYNHKDTDKKQERFTEDQYSSTPVRTTQPLSTFLYSTPPFIVELEKEEYYILYMTDVVFLCYTAFWVF